jgi:murein DD-endopeptidase MepM/ murein hydrolase activator NlpD
MKKNYIFLILLALAISLSADRANCFSHSDIISYPRTINQGDIGLIRLKAIKGEQPRLKWQKRDVPLQENKENAEWFGFLSADLNTAPGVYQVKINVSPQSEEVLLKVKITEKDYGVRNLTLPKHMVDLDSKTLQRVRKEAKVVRTLWKEPYVAGIWRESFIKPLDGEIIGPFGRKSVINKQPRSPHSGVDFRASKGTPVKAMNSGVVVLVAEHFFAGKSVVVDHGGGIQSMYFHLDRIMVKKDEHVTRGQVLGQVGSTGRATGPHLHLGVRVNGARVDPMRLIEVSQQVE